MQGEVLIILFKNDKAYITNGKDLSLDQINISGFIKSFKTPAYWSIKVLDHDTNSNSIFVEVLGYSVGVTQFSNNQVKLFDKLNVIDEIRFKSIDTLCAIKSSKTVNKQTISHPDAEYVNRNEPSLKLDDAYVRIPIPRIIKEKYHIPLKNIKFKNGHVTFIKKVSGYEKVIEFSIENKHIKEEFDAIKNYFSNVLNTKKVSVVIEVEIIDNELVGSNAKSTQIEKIDSSFISDVKLEILRVSKKRKSNSNKTLFTKEEYFEEFTEENFNSDFFYENDLHFFEDLIKISKTKHYKHLRYLSSKHLRNIMKLRFVHKPFSFVFLIEGNEMYHLVWETLDTEEATYIWSYPKQTSKMRTAVSQIESIINEIKSQGKLSYIKSKEEHFIRVYHDYTQGDNGFLKWKKEFDYVLTQGVELNFF